MVAELSALKESQHWLHDIEECLEGAPFKPGRPHLRRIMRLLIHADSSDFTADEIASIWRSLAQSLSLLGRHRAAFTCVLNGLRALVPAAFLDRAGSPKTLRSIEISRLCLESVRTAVKLGELDIAIEIAHEAAGHLRVLGAEVPTEIADLADFCLPLIAEIVESGEGVCARHGRQPCPRPQQSLRASSR